MTAAALAKQRPRQLLPLPQPIPAALDTRVKSVQGIEAVLTSMRGRLQVCGEPWSCVVDVTSACRSGT
jgi:hypothetical protein